MKSSSAGSRPRPCCPAPKPPPCCSGRCSPPGRSPCARSTDGRPSPTSHLTRSLTSPHDRIASCRPKTRQQIPTQLATGPAEAEVGRDDDAGAFVQLTQQMEEQRSAGGAEWQVAEFVEDDEVGVGKPPGDLSGLALKLFLFERIDELDGGEEPDALAMMFDGLDADRGCEMRLAGSGAADQDDVVSVLQKLAAVKLAYERFIHLAAGEVEAGEVAVVWEARGLELVGRRSDLPVGRLRLQELRQDRQRGLEGRRALFGQLADSLGHSVHFEAAKHDDDGAGGGIMTHGAPPGLCAGRRSARHRPVVRW